MEYTIKERRALMGNQVFCQKCSEPRGKSTNPLLCQKCINSLPQCYNCGIICGIKEKEWGYDTEEEAIPCILKKNRKNINLCGSCKRKLVEKKELGPDLHGKFLLEDVEISSMELK